MSRQQLTKMPVPITSQQLIDMYGPRTRQQVIKEVSILSKIPTGYRGSQNKAQDTAIYRERQNRMENKSSDHRDYQIGHQTVALNP
jgi:hypothetical protein